MRGDAEKLRRVRDQPGRQRHRRPGEDAAATEPRIEVAHGREPGRHRGLGAHPRQRSGYRRRRPRSDKMFSALLHLEGERHGPGPGDHAKLVEAPTAARSSVSAPSPAAAPSSSLTLPASRAMGRRNRERSHPGRRRREGHPARLSGLLLKPRGLSRSSAGGLRRGGRRSSSATHGLRPGAHRPRPGPRQVSGMDVLEDAKRCAEPRRGRDDHRPRLGEDRRRGHEGSAPIDYVPSPSTTTRSAWSCTAPSIAPSASRRENRLAARAGAAPVRLREADRHGSGDAPRCSRRSQKVAETDLTVLVRGESGTGKELVAQALHNRSSAQEPALRRGQLRGHQPRAGRERALRPREGAVHRRRRAAQSAASRPPTGAPSSSTRSATCRRDPGQGPARPPGAQASSASGAQRPPSVDVRVVAATH